MPALALLLSNNNVQGRTYRGQRINCKVSRVEPSRCVLVIAQTTSSCNPSNLLQCGNLSMSSGAARGFPRGALLGELRGFSFSFFNEGAFPFKVGPIAAADLAEPGAKLLLLLPLPVTQLCCRSTAARPTLVEAGRVRGEENGGGGVDAASSQVSRFY